MARGEPTPDDVEQEFRKHYLVTGNVAGSAKAVGLPISTGYELRNRAHDDPVFVEARERIRARLEPDAEQMAVCAMQLCMERLNITPDEILQKMQMMTAGTESARISFQDPGPQYAASFAKLYQALIGARKFEADREGITARPTEVTIVLAPSAEASARLAKGEDASSGSTSD